MSWVRVQSILSLSTLSIVLIFTQCVMADEEIIRDNQCFEIKKVQKLDFAIETRINLVSGRYPNLFPPAILPNGNFLVVFNDNENETKFGIIDRKTGKVIAEIARKTNSYGTGNPSLSEIVPGQLYYFPDIKDSAFIHILDNGLKFRFESIGISVGSRNAVSVLGQDKQLLIYLVDKEGRMMSGNYTPGRDVGLGAVASIGEPVQGTNLVILNDDSILLTTESGRAARYFPAENRIELQTGTTLGKSSTYNSLTNNSELVSVQTTDEGGLVGKLVIYSKDLKVKKTVDTPTSKWGRVLRFKQNEFAVLNIVGDLTFFDMNLQKTGTYSPGSGVKYETYTSDLRSLKSLPNSIIYLTPDGNLNVVGEQYKSLLKIAVGSKLAGFTVNNSDNTVAIVSNSPSQMVVGKLGYREVLKKEIVNCNGSNNGQNTQPEFERQPEEVKPVLDLEKQKKNGVPYDN